MEKKFDPKKTVFLIDGSAFLYRAYYSLPPMHTKDGTPVQVVYGFCRMIKKLISSFAPAYVGVIWDPAYTGVPGERAQLYEDYKANRQASPREFAAQKQLIKEFLETINVFQLEFPGLEADDILYSLAKDFSQQAFSTVLVTGDKDMGQCVNEKIVLFDPFKELVYDTQALEVRYQVPVNKLVFYFSLIGDSADNIPGVRGIGPKTAVQLVNQFSSLDDLYDHTYRIEKERTKKLVEEGKEAAFLSQALFVLRYHPFNVSPYACSFQSEQWWQAGAFFKRLDFSSLLKDFPTESLESLTTATISEECPLVDNTCVIIDTELQLQELATLIRARGACAVDTETDSVSPLQAKLVGISLCVEEGTAYYIPVGHSEQHTSSMLSLEAVIKYLKPIFQDTHIEKYFHNAKFDMLVLSAHGLPVKNIAFDTFIAAHLVAKEGYKLSLKAVSERYTGRRMLTYNEVVTQKKYKNFSEVPLAQAAVYASADAHQTFLLVPLLRQELEKHKQQELFQSLELPLIPVLYAMEKEGITLDTQVLTTLAAQAHKDSEMLENYIKSLLPAEWQTINLNSPRQLEELLFTVLELPPVKKTASKAGYSTDQEVLQELSKLHPVPALIVKHRELSKVKSTYLDALGGYVNPLTGRIHTSFNQAGTATGRLSSSDPNLQNIPTGLTPGSFAIRSAFKAPDEYLFLSVDYSQIELRILAYLSQDVNLLGVFLSGQDIHTQTAAKIFNISLDAVLPEQRALAKRINFSILYGLSAYSLSKDLALSFKEAQEYIDRYFAQYPQVVSWMDTVIAQAKEHGYVTTLWGRRRYVPGIFEKNRNLYDLARRVAINTQVQGTQAELIKLGMLAVERSFLELNLDARLVLQIHDELLITVKASQVDHVEQVVKDVLQKLVSWNVPLVVTTRKGTTWQEVTK